MSSEPVLTAASALAVVSAVIAVLVAFGVHLTDAQVAAILGLVGVVAPIALAFVVRSKVTPVDES